MLDLYNGVSDLGLARLLSVLWNHVYLQYIYFFRFFQEIAEKGTRQKKKKNVKNSTLGLTPPMTEIVENFQKKKTKSFKKIFKSPK